MSASSVLNKGSRRQPIFIFFDNVFIKCQGDDFHVNEALG